MRITRSLLSLFAFVAVSNSRGNANPRQDFFPRDAVADPKTDNTNDTTITSPLMAALNTGKNISEHDNVAGDSIEITMPKDHDTTNAQTTNLRGSELDTQVRRALRDGKPISIITSGRIFRFNPRPYTGNPVQTIKPTLKPTASPPTLRPTSKPPTPTISYTPSLDPSAEPSTPPTQSPSKEPTDSPTIQPTRDCLNVYVSEKKEKDTVFSIVRNIFYNSLLAHSFGQDCLRILDRDSVDEACNSAVELFFNQTTPSTDGSLSKYSTGIDNGNITVDSTQSCLEVSQGSPNITDDGFPLCGKNNSSDFTDIANICLELGELSSSSKDGKDSDSNSMLITGLIIGLVGTAAGLGAYVVAKNSLVKDGSNNKRAVSPNGHSDGFDDLVPSNRPKEIKVSGNRGLDISPVR